MSVDNKVRVVIITERNLSISNNSPINAAREAVRTVWNEIGNFQGHVIVEYDDEDNRRMIEMFSMGDLQ